MAYNFDAFKYTISGPEQEMYEISNLLIRSRPGAPNGSSFAVTSNAGPGMRCIHLSETSYRTLTKLNIIPALYQLEPT